MPSAFLERIRAGGVLIADGATGTMLQQWGLPVGACPEEWNLSHPEAIASLAKEYAAAGSDLVYTNTFGANRWKLRKYGLEERLREINEAAVQIARSAVGEGVLLVGDMGMTGELLEPLGELTFDEAVDVFAEQAVALAESGVDAIVAETFAAIDEAKAALKACKENTNLPCICTMSFDMGGRTMMGVTPEEAVRVLADAGADVVGANCGGSLPDTFEAIRKMKAQVPTLPLIAKPNAGLPKLVEGRAVYEVTPEEMARYALRFAFEAGACIVGGCCGSTPKHVAAIARALKGKE